MTMNNVIARLQDKSSFTYMAYKVFKSKLFSSIVLFLSSVILIRALPKDDYGLYVLALVFFSFFELLLGGMDASLIRYIGVSGKKVQHQLIATVLTIKTLVMFIVIVALITFFDLSKELLNIPIEKIEIYEKLYFIISVSFIFKYITTTTATLITSYMLYDLAFKLTLFNASTIFLISCSVWYFGLNIWQYVLLSTIFSLLYSLVSAYTFILQKKIVIKQLKQYKNIFVIKYILKEKVISYSLPLFGVGVLSYAKNQLPSYIFGTMVSLESLAVYSIFKRLLDFLHKGYAGVIQGLFPKILKMIASKSKIIDKLFWLGLITRLIIFIVLYFEYEKVLQLYDIHESKIDKLLYLVLLFSFLINYFGTFLTMVIMSKTKMVKLLQTSSIRAIIGLLFTVLLFKYFGLMGLIYSIYVVAYIGIIALFFVENTLESKYKKLFYFILIISHLPIFWSLYEVT